MKLSFKLIITIGLLLCVVAVKSHQSEIYKPAAAIDWSKNPKINKQLLKNANVVYLDSDQGHIAKKDIYIEGEKIVSIVKTNSLDNAKDVVVTDLKGKFVIPGLIDTHVHLATFPSHNDSIDHNKVGLKKALLDGVTTVQDMGGDARLLSFLARMTLVGDLEGPRIYYSASFSGSDFFTDFRVKGSTEGFVPGSTPWYRSVDASSNLDTELIRAHAIGSNITKLYADIDFDLAKKFIPKAKEAGFPVIAHANTFPAKPSELIDAGVNSITHIGYLVWEDMPYEKDYRKRKNADYINYPANSKAIVDLLKKMASQDIYLDPTLWVTGKIERKGMYDWSIATLKTAHEVGVKFTAGSDSLTSDEESNAIIHSEMKLYVDKLGLSNAEALRTATVYPAKLLNLDKIVGTIAEGLGADLVILNDNPLVDIKNTLSIDQVVSRGRIFKKE